MQTIFIAAIVLAILAWIFYIFVRALVFFPLEIYKSNLKQGLTKYIFSLIAFILIISPYFYFKHNQEIKWENTLPLELETSGSVLIHESFDFREGCAVGIFKLSDSTLGSINSKGLKFFEHATKPRNPEEKGWEYESWSKINSRHTYRKYNNYTVDLINCNRELDKETIDELYAATTDGSSYVTYYKGASLVVVPSLGYAIRSGGS